MSQFDTARPRHCEFRWRVCVHAAWLTRDSRRVSLPQQPEPVGADEDASRERQIIKAALAGSRGRLEYRRIGNPGGGWPGTLDDVRTGAAHLEKIAAERSLDLKRVVAMGHSEGGHLVLLAGETERDCAEGPSGACPGGGIAPCLELKLSNTAVADLLGGSPQDLPDRYRSASPIELMPLGVAQRVLHGSNDYMVSLNISYGMSLPLKSGDDSKLIEVAGQDTSS